MEENQTIFLASNHVLKVYSCLKTGIFNLLVPRKDDIQIAINKYFNPFIVLYITAHEYDGRHDADYPGCQGSTEQIQSGHQRIKG